MQRLYVHLAVINVPHVDLCQFTSTGANERGGASEVNCHTHNEQTQSVQGII